MTQLQKHTIYNKFIMYVNIRKTSEWVNEHNLTIFTTEGSIIVYSLDKSVIQNNVL